MRIVALLLIIFSLSFAHSLSSLPLTNEEISILATSKKEAVNGWLRIKINGTPYNRGFQYGYNIAEEFAEAWRVFEAMTFLTTGKSMRYFSDVSVQLHKGKIPQEYIEEMTGIADGLTKAGFNMTLDDIIGWNDNLEITNYWWPVQQAKQGREIVTSKGFCSAFVATGNATKDGKIVIGHNTFTEFWNGQFLNVVLDVTPSKGYRMVYQTSPGWIASGTDFWINSAGLMVVETTIAGFFGYDDKKLPDWVRSRLATQYSSSIDEWVNSMNKENNGGFANMWLIGDRKTNEIAEFEQGLKYQSLVKKTDGYIFGENAPNDPRIRHLECVYTGYSDVRQQTGARRVRWRVLLDQNYGKIDSQVGTEMLADQYDVYLHKINPSSRTICAHYDVDPQEYADNKQGVWNTPFYPAGSVDAKVTSSDLSSNMDVLFRFGRGDGVAFDVNQFVTENPQWAWQKDYLVSRPSQPWTYFNGTN